MLIALFVALTLSLLSATPTRASLSDHRPVPHVRSHEQPLTRLAAPTPSATGANGGDVAPTSRPWSPKAKDTSSSQVFFYGMVAAMVVTTGVVVVRARRARTDLDRDGHG